jgi:hypothetical protein
MDHPKEMIARQEDHAEPIIMSSLHPVIVSRGTL